MRRTGEAAAACAKVLVNGGTMVTYGAMSQQVGNISAWLQHIPLV